MKLRPKGKKMKRKPLVALVALSGGIAVVGSGFASWYFDTTALSTDTKNVSTYVTDLNDGIGTLTDNNKDDSLYVILDQGGYSKKDSLTDGISITNVSGTVSDSNTGTAVASLSATYSIAKAQYTTLNAAGINSGNFTATLTIPEAAQAYVQFQTAYTGITPTASTGDLTVTATSLTYKYKVDWTSASADNVRETFTIETAGLLQYVTGKKPTDKTAYDAMKTALAGKTIFTVAYSFAVNTTNA